MWAELLDALSLSASKYEPKVAQNENASQAAATAFLHGIVVFAFMVNFISPV